MLSCPAWAATHYVWCGAAGTATGADFTNAYTDLPASLTRGDTYKIAGTVSCTYARHVFQDTESGSTLITISHVVSGDSGIAGYQSSFATAVASWSTANTSDVWEIKNSYYTLDGITGSGTSGHGFKMSSDTTYTGAFIYVFTGIGNITVNHLEIDGVNCCDIANSSSGTSAFYSVSSSGGHSASINLNYDYFHNLKGDPIFLIWNDTSTFDHIVVAVNRSTAAQHSQGIQFYGVTSFTIRYSIWVDITGTAFWTNVGSANSSTLAFYGNVAYFTGTDPQWANCTNPCVQDSGVTGPQRGVSALFESIQGAGVAGLKFYNNTMFGFDAVHAPVNAGFFNNVADTGYDVQDNLWFNAQGGVAFQEGGIGTHDYNTILNGSISNGSAQTHEFVTASGSTNPFVSSASGNFNLSSETVVSNLNNGLNLNSLLSANTTDPSAITRGTDATWERGAYEFVSGAVVPTTAPAIGMFARLSH